LSNAQFSDSSILNPAVYQYIIALFNNPWIAVLAIFGFGAALSFAVDTIVDPSRPLSLLRRVKSFFVTTASIYATFIIIFVVFTPLAFRWFVDTSSMVACLVFCGIGLTAGAIAVRKIQSTRPIRIVGRIGVVSACLSSVLLIIMGIGASLHPRAFDTIWPSARAHVLSINGKPVSVTMQPIAAHFEYNYGNNAWGKRLPADTDFLVRLSVAPSTFAPRSILVPGRAPIVERPLVSRVDREYLVPRLTGSFMTVSPVNTVAWDTRSGDAPPDWNWYVHPNSTGPQALTLQLIQTSNQMLDQGTVSDSTAKIILTILDPVTIDERKLGAADFQLVVYYLSTFITVAAGIVSLVVRKKEDRADLGTPPVSAS
jgi:hypothetical protein